MPPTLLALLSEQCGVVARRQLVRLELNDDDIARLVRRRVLVRVRRGVYVDHTGSLDWAQQCWASVLGAAPAALAGESALRWTEGAATRRTSGVVELAVPWEVKRPGCEGVVINRRRDFATVLHPGSGIPRLRYEEAVVDVVSAADDDMTRVSQLALALNSRRTNVQRLQACAAGRSRLAARGDLDRLLGDMAHGTCSVLEHGLLDRVERPHALPVSRRQVRATVRHGVVYRDAMPGNGLCLELDGRLHERTDERERDFDRDLAAAVQGLTTVRLSYGQVFRRACWTAGQLSTLYRAHGWQGRAQPCGLSCSVRS